MGEFQEKQPLLIFQKNSMSNLLCTGAICENTTQKSPSSA